MFYSIYVCVFPWITKAKFAIKKNKKQLFKKLSLIENHFYFFFFSFIVQVFELESRRIEQNWAATANSLTNNSKSNQQQIIITKKIC